MPKPPSEQPLWWVTVSAPQGAGEVLGLPSHVRQVTAYGRAPSRAAFARALIAAEVAWESPASVSRFVRDYGSTSSNPADLAAITDSRVYLGPTSGNPDDRQRIPWPLPDTESVECTTRDHQRCGGYCRDGELCECECHDEQAREYAAQ